jgi:Tol biopolymer transport system component
VHLKPSIASLAVAAALALVSGCGGSPGDASSGSVARADHGILFSSKRDGDFDIYVMDADGGNVRQLTKNEAEGANEADDGSPSWSPDGERIAFLSTRDHEGDGFDSEELYVMDGDGSGQSRLTKNATGEGEPSWSPDGKWVL